MRTAQHGRNEVALRDASARVDGLQRRTRRWPRPPRERIRGQSRGGAVAESRFGGPARHRGCRASVGSCASTQAAALGSQQREGHARRSSAAVLSSMSSASGRRRRPRAGIRAVGKSGSHCDPLTRGSGGQDSSGEVRIPSACMRILQTRRHPPGHAGRDDRGPPGRHPGDGSPRGVRCRDLQPALREDVDLVVHTGDLFNRSTSTTTCGPADGGAPHAGRTAGSRWSWSPATTIAAGLVRYLPHRLDDPMGGGPTRPS